MVSVERVYVQHNVSGDSRLSLMQHDTMIVLLNDGSCCDGVPGERY